MGRGVAIRSVLAVLAVLLTIGSSMWGTDDLWPFAPFRMYATATRLDGQVLSATFAGFTPEGEEFRIYAGHLGLRPAEVEGQRLPGAGLPEPLMSDLAEGWNERHPDREIVRLELRLVGSRLEDGKPVEAVSRTVDTWVAP